MEGGVDMKDILSLGAGVQSTCVLLMSCKGVLPTLDAAVFADTGWEPKAVYRHLEWLEGEAKKAGIPTFRVGSPTIKEDALKAAMRNRNEIGKVDSVHLPYYTKEEGAIKKGIIRRQCTVEYKIYPMEKFMRREILGLRKGQRAPREAVINLWFGISADELRRTRISKNRWCVNVYPLPGLPDQMLPKAYTRHDCSIWMHENYPEINPPRSACVCCPFHSNAEWRRMRDETPDEWVDAVDFDRTIRNSGGLKGKLYLHNDCVPLDLVDLSTAEDHGQGDLFDGFRDECMGVCSV